MLKGTIKLLSITLLIFTLGFTFVGQNLIVNAADPVVPPTTTSTTTPAPKPLAAKSDGPAIGSLKDCVVDKSRKDISSEDGNKIIRDCIKSVINLVITLAVLISIASLVGYGIQLMNPMMESGKINGQIVERIKSLAIGGLILGSFGTILATINPATLTSNQLLGKPVIDSFREYISLGVKNAPPSKGVSGGAGGGTGGNAPFDTALAFFTKGGTTPIDKTLLNLPANSANKKILVDELKKESECKIPFGLKTECINYTPIKPDIIAKLATADLKVVVNRPKFMKGPLNTYRKIDDIVETGKGSYSIIYAGETLATQVLVKITNSGGPCVISKLPLEAGKELVPTGCTLELGE